MGGGKKIPFTITTFKPCFVKVIAQALDKDALSYINLLSHPINQPTEHQPTRTREKKNTEPSSGSKSVGWSYLCCAVLFAKQFILEYFGQLFVLFIQSTAPGRGKAKQRRPERWRWVKRWRIFSPALWWGRVWFWPRLARWHSYYCLERFRDDFQKFFTIFKAFSVLPISLSVERRFQFRFSGNPATFRNVETSERAPAPLHRPMYLSNR